MGKVIPLRPREPEPYRWFCSGCGAERDASLVCPACGSTGRQTWKPEGYTSGADGFFGVRLRP